MLDEKTLNPVPPLDDYNWTEVLTPDGLIAIIFNVSFSSEFPFYNRSITLTLCQDNQSRALSPSTDFAKFKFYGINPQQRECPLKASFSAVDPTDTPLAKGGEIGWGRNSKMPITPLTTPRHMVKN